MADERMSESVLKVLKDALVNLGEIRCGGKNNVSRGVQECELFFKNGFTDEVFEDVTFLTHETGFKAKTNRYVITTCEGLECFFIPCLDLENFHLGDFLKNLYGLADCLLDDLEYLCQRVLIDDKVYFMGDPYALRTLKKQKKSVKSNKEEVVENTDAASFILSTTLMARHFTNEIVLHSFHSKEYNLEELNNKLEKILYKGVNELLRLNKNVGGKGWPLAVESIESSIFGTWATLEFVSDLFNYKEKLSFNIKLDSDTWKQLENAKSTTLKWLEDEAVKIAKKEIQFSESEKKEYRQLNVDLLTLEGRLRDECDDKEEFDSKYNRESEKIVRKFEETKKEKKTKIEEKYLLLYDKVQIIFGLLLCDSPNNMIIEKGMDEIFEYYFDRAPDGIWENFINLYYPPNKDYDLAGNASLSDYGIVFEMMRLILKYGEQQQKNIFLELVKKHQLEDKLDRIYREDIINDKNTEEEQKFKYLWSKYDFELNYTENAIEALSGYVNFLYDLEGPKKVEETPKGTMAISFNMDDLVQALVKNKSFEMLIKQGSGIQEKDVVKIADDVVTKSIRDLKEFKRNSEVAVEELKKLVPHVEDIVSAAIAMKKAKKNTENL